MPNQTRGSQVLEAIQGKWRVVYSEVDGELTPVDEFVSIILEHKGNRFTIQKKGVIVHEGTFTINVSVVPFELVYIYEKGNPIYLGGPRPGIFQIYGDTFKTCMGAIGHRFPKDFNTFENSAVILSIHQRIVPEGGVEIPGKTVSAERAVSQW